jgi:hypothetical protein
MNVKKVVGIIITTLAVNVFFMADASAESIRLRCESRGTARAKISVDGRGFATNKVYRASVTSGGVTIGSKTAKRPGVNHEVGFDFDSDRGDIAAGATAIPKTFIKNNVVSASIIDPNGFKVSVSESCKAK